MIGDIFYVILSFFREEYISLLVWWAIPLALSFGFYFVLSEFFKPSRYLTDGGWALSRALGPFCWALVAWLLSSVRVFPFYLAANMTALSALVLALFILTKRREKIFKKLRKRIILTEEIIFAAAFVSYSLLRSLRPEINGMEKFMDFGIINSILKSIYMPPMDMWQAGESLNYYYFGHFTTAFISKIALYFEVSHYLKITPEKSYNLMLALIVSVTSIMAFSIAHSVTRHFKKGVKGTASPCGVWGKAPSLLAGFIAVLLTCLGGNLHAFIYAEIAPLLGKAGNYWYPDATRFVGYFPPTGDKTIHEFPVYSFVVSDLHSHVLALPLGLSCIAIAFCLFLYFYKKKKPKDNLTFIFPGIVLGIIYMTDTWAYPIYWGLLSLSIFLPALLSYSSKKILTALSFAALYGVILIFISQVIAYPFSFYFKSMASGVALAKAHTPYWQILVLWGSPIIWGLTYGALVYYKKIPRCAAKIFLSLLFAYGAFLVLIPEAVYVRDIYEAGYARANTMFKFTYEAFVILAIASAVSAALIINTRKPAPVIAACLILSMPLSYPARAIDGYYLQYYANNYNRISLDVSLDGLGFLRERSLGDYFVVKILRGVEPLSVAILEAPGDSYSEYGRISMATGHSTIQGWTTHEWLWRGNRDIVTARENEVRAAYTDAREAKKIIAKYDIKYIIIGELEKEKYGAALDEEGLRKLGKAFFDELGTCVIDVEEIKE